MIKEIFSKVWPVLFIFLIWFIFSSPYFLKNKVPYASTYQVNHFSPWSSYEKFGGPVKNGAMPDVTSQIYPWKHFTIESLKQGIIPLWNPYSFSGTPHLANYQSAVLSPFNFLFFIFSFVDAWSLLVLIQPLLAGLFTFIFLRSLRVSRFGSLISSVSFMFCGFITVWMGYATLGYAILFLPLVLFAIEKFYLTSLKRYLILLSATLPLSFFSGHFQISLYFFLFVLGYVIYKFIETKNKQKTKIISLHLLAGLFLAAPQLLPSIEQYLQAFRSTLVGKGGTISLQYIPTFFAPDFYGNPVTRNDWFGPYAEWNAYIGVTPMLLGLFVIMKKRSKLVLFFAITALISLLLAFGSPLLDLLIILKIPVLSTSPAGRIIVIFSFSMTILAGLGFDALSLGESREKIKSLIKYTMPGLFVFVALWAVVGLKLFLPIDKIQIAKSNLYLPTLLFLVSVPLFYISKFKKTRTAVLLVLIALVSFDMLRFATKWQAFDPKSLVFPDVPITKQYDKISGYDRVFGQFGAEDSVYYHLPSIEGYDAVYQQRYGEFIASLQTGKVTSPGWSVVSFPKYGTYAKKAFDFLGIKYLVHKVSDARFSWEYPFWLYPKEFKQIYKDNLFEIYENTKALPRAFLVSNYKVATSSQKILDEMFDKNTDLRKTVVVEKNPGFEISNNTKSSAQIVSYSSNKVIIKTNSDNPSLLFLSDTYYPGWRATVNGKDAEILRADYAFRAVKVGGGENIVEFSYVPKSFWLGVVISAMGILFLALKYRVKE